MPVRVETTLSERTYEGLRRRAEQEGRSVEEVVATAVERLLALDAEEDPPDGFIGAGTLARGEGSERNDWRDPWRKHRDGSR